MKNNEKMKWYILIAVALVVGALIGYFATNSFSATGNAKTAISNLANDKVSNYDLFAHNEITKYKQENNLNEKGKSYLIYRPSTDGKLTASKLVHYDLSKYTYNLTKKGIVLLDDASGEITQLDVDFCAYAETDTTSPNGGTATVTWHYNGADAGGWVQKDFG